MAIDLDNYYRKFGPMVHRRCKELLKNEEDALDVMQEVFVKLLRLDSKEIQSPSSYLYVMATRLSLNRIRSQRRRPEDPASDFVYEVAHLESGRSRSQARFLLDKLFAQSKDSTQLIAILHYHDGLTLQEVADQVGMSVSGVRRRLRVLRKELKSLEVAK